MPAVVFTLAVKRKVKTIFCLGFVWGLARGRKPPGFMPDKFWLNAGGFACWRVITLKAPRFSLWGAGAFKTAQLNT